MKQELQGSVQDFFFRRKFIISCVEFYKSRFPEEYKSAIEHAKEVRQSRANVFGDEKSRKLDFRFTLTIPMKLAEMITPVLKEPEFLRDKEEYIWFIKNFKEFTAAEKPL